MSEKRTCQEAKSLRWLANMFPEIKNPKNNEEHVCNCIHAYCTAGANRIEELLARVGSKDNNNDTELDGTSDRMERIKEAAPEMYELLEHFTLTCACASCTCDDREKARREARNLFARIYRGENDGE